MPVSDKARKAVIKASGGLCEIFHEYPVEGNHIVHPTHQGIGGASKDAPCNDPTVLLWGCQSCHDLVDGRLKSAPHKIVKFDRAARELAIMEYGDEGYRRVPDERIFFHLKPQWDEALERYPKLVDAIRRRNEAEFDLAKNLAPFRPARKGPELFRVCPEIQQMKHATFYTFIALLGMTSAAAKELMPIGDWLNEEGLDSMRGIDMDAIDALRQAPEEEVERLMGLTARPVKFWKAIEKLNPNKHGRRTHYLSHNEETGELEDLGLLAVEPDVADAFCLIKGRIVRGGKEDG